MSHFFKRYSLLIIAQTFCLALGLWLEHCFIVSLAESTSQNKAESAQVATGTGVAGEASPVAAALENAASEETPILAIRITTLIWIAAIQAVFAYLILTRNQEEAARKHQEAKNVSLQQYNELLRTRDAVIFGLAKLAESRDPDTGNHLERIAIYSTRLAAALRHDPLYRSQITPSFVKLIGISSALHDIGKVGIRDSILLKPGKLDPPGIGRSCNCMRPLAESASAKSNPGWDARISCGWPAISLSAIMNIGTARDIPRASPARKFRWRAGSLPLRMSMTPYPRSGSIRKRFPHEKCVEMIREEAGKQFDPVLVKAFLKLEAEFHEIAQSCRETVESKEITAYCPETMADMTVETAIKEELASLETLLEGCEKALHAPPSNDEFRKINSMNCEVENTASPIEREPENVH